MIGSAPIRHLPILRLAWLLFFSLMFMPISQAADSRAVAMTIASQLPTTTWIGEGDGQKIVYFFFDPNCPHCNEAYERMKPILAADRDFQMRYVPMGVLLPSSAGKAAAIMQSADPLGAYHRMEEGYGFSAHGDGGAIDPIKDISPATQKALDANYAILKSNHIPGMPLIVFQGDDGKPFMMFGSKSTEFYRKLLAHVAPGPFGGGHPIP
jgi:thiol:disulfide interchange protein DsbG